MTLLFPAFILAGCSKDCDRYSVKDNDDCIPWNQRFAGTWVSSSSIYCSDGTPFLSTISLSRGSADNIIKVDNNIFLTCMSPTYAESEIYTLGDNNGTWTVKMTCSLTPGYSENQIVNGGVIGTVYHPGKMNWTTIKNPGLSTANTCSGTFMEQ